MCSSPRGLFTELKATADGVPRQAHRRLSAMGELERRGVLSRLSADPAAEPQLVRMALAVDDSVLDESPVLPPRTIGVMLRRSIGGVLRWPPGCSRSPVAWRWNRCDCAGQCPWAPTSSWRGGGQRDPQPVQPAEAAEGTARMRSALQTLPPEQRRALVMAAVYGYARGRGERGGARAPGDGQLDPDRAAQAACSIRERRGVLVSGDRPVTGDCGAFAEDLVELGPGAAHWPPQVRRSGPCKKGCPRCSVNVERPSGAPQQTD